MKPDLKWLEDPEVFRVNRLDAHSDHICFSSQEELAAGSTSLRQDLSGIWRVKWSPAPGQRPADFWKEEFDDRDFSPIKVPGHGELQGLGQIQYINTLYPWDGRSDIRPPRIDWEDTPVLSYICRFSLAPGLRNKRVCISFQGVEQAFFLWLNGHFVGYAEDSFTPSDFDLTPWLREEGNRLCLEVYKHCSGGWLEDQDFFRFSGIFRSVFLYGKPMIHIEDVWFHTDWEPETGHGRLKLRLKLSGPAERARLSCSLSHKVQGLRLDESIQLDDQPPFWWSQEFLLEDILPWSHEFPELYHVLLTLTDDSGHLLELIPYDIGFRRFSLEGGLMLLNGKRLVLRGVNRHEWNPAAGRAIGLEDMEKAIEVFRRNNINAVRTSHYPNATPWYGLCDRSGIYVMDETNLESHGSWQKLGKVDPSWNVPGSKPEWKACVLDRAESMFERDKNHPSILFWSCGNESYAGKDILSMADYFRSQDPSRLVHYEGVFHNRSFDAISDVESRMYAPPKDIRAYLETSPRKPFLLCEYMHDMGNSLGGMESYIRLQEEFPQYQGGFIWDYMDQALWQQNVLGEWALGYGGDFSDRQTDYAFSGNGLLFADGQEKPAMQEVRYWYSSKKQREEWDRKNAEERIKASLPAPGSKAPLRFVHGDGALGVRTETSEILFSYSQGGPVSLIKDGCQWLWRAPRPALWRAPTENDIGSGFQSRSSIWASVDSLQVCQDLRILQENEKECAVCYTYRCPALPSYRAEVTYTVTEDRILRIQCRYLGQKGHPQLPLFGLRMETPVPIAETQWLGLSGETYPDRKKGAAFGLHREAPHLPPYLVPQEYGCHTDTEQVVLKMRDGQSLTICRQDQPFSFSALPYTPHQLQQACHSWELPRPCRTVLTLCGAMRGVGGIDSWGADVEESFHISGEEDHDFFLNIPL